MAMVVLVGYASAHGSTQGVAKRIGDRLQQRGVAVDVRPVSDVQDLGRYDAAVLGSAVHGGKWLPTAEQFMDRNTAGLRERPVWLFSVRYGDHRNWAAIEAWADLIAVQVLHAAVAGPRSPVQGLSE